MSEKLVPTNLASAFDVHAYDSSREFYEEVPQASTLQSLAQSIAAVQNELRVMRGQARPADTSQGANIERLQQQVDGLTAQMGQMRLNTSVDSTFGGAGGAGGEEPRHSSNVSMPTASPGTPYSVAPAFQMAPRPPNIKALVCELLDAKGRYPGQGLGFGFEDFERRWEHAIATDIAIYGSNWTDFLKVMLMVKFMAARPAKLFHDNYESWKLENPTFSYKDCRQKYLKQYGCRLSGPELVDRLREPKKKHFTWLDYAEYLLEVGRLLNADNRLVLETFALYACPEEKSTLLVLVNLNATNPRPELEKALEFLYRVKGDGVLNDKSHNVSGNRTAVKNDRKNKNDSTRIRHHEHGSANINVGEGRRCFLCNKTGHIKKYYPNRRRQQVALVQETQGTLKAVSTTITGEDKIPVASCWTAQGNQVPASQHVMWLLDSGASHHIKNDHTVLQGVRSCCLDVTVAKKMVIRATEVGDVTINLLVDGYVRNITVKDIHHIPSAGGNILSVSKLAERGVVVEFNENGATVRDKPNANGQQKVVAKLPWIRGLCYLVKTPVKFGSVTVANMTADTLMGWHKRLGHLNTTDVMRMNNHDILSGMRVTNKKVLPCDVCIEAKQSRSIKSSADSATHARTDEVGAVLCIDLKVHLKPFDWQGNEHVLHIVDHASNHGDVFAMKTKDQWLPLLI